MRKNTPRRKTCPCEDCSKWRRATYKREIFLAMERAIKEKEADRVKKRRSLDQAYYMARIADDVAINKLLGIKSKLGTKKYKPVYKKRKKWHLRNCHLKRVG